MIKKKDIIALAKKRAKRLKQLRKDPRYSKVIGRLRKEGLIDANVPKNNRKFYLEEALWVGENIEPRVIELLPAIVLKKPSLFVIKDFPQPLAEAANKLKRGANKLEYRGIPLRRCEQWIPFVGRKGKLPSAMKSFRFQKEDLDLLRELSSKFSESETKVIRKALQKLKKAS